MNPYVLDNLKPYTGGENYPFVYPPHTLYFFWLLDFFFIFHYLAIWYVFLVILMVISGYLIVRLDQKPNYFFLTVLLLTGFMGAFWNFITGNKDIIFLFAFAVIFTLLVKGKYWQSSIIMGLATGISLITAPFIALYLFIKRPFLERLTLMFLSAGVVAILFILSYLVNPSYLFSYISFLLGGYLSSSFESGGWLSPTPYFMFKDILGGNIVLIVIVSGIYIGLILYATWNYYLKYHEDTLKIYSLVLLSIFMLLPRIQPYEFIILAIPLYFLFKDSSYKIKSLILTVIFLVPFIVWASPNYIIHQMGSYAQTYCLIFVFLLFILLDYLTPSNFSARE